MTHFTVGIIVPHDKFTRIKSFIAQQMAPYDEGIKVAPYVCYSAQKAKAEIERDIQRFERIIDRCDPDYDLDKCREVLGRLRITTPEEKYREYVQFHEHFSAQGEPLSTYNPDSKWDWYVIGGRWDGWINGKETSGDHLENNKATTGQALERGIIPHAIITPDGQWHERGKMGWWAIMITENEDWDTRAKELLSTYASHHVVILDAHI
jgi:hypothetical protein